MRIVCEVGIGSFRELELDKGRQPGCAGLGRNGEASWYGRGFSAFTKLEASRVAFIYSSRAR